MLTPPYHFSISATSHPPIKDGISSTEILYRGSIPAPRNKSFIRRLNLKTIVVLRKKQLKDDDALIVWCKKRGIQVRWIKAEEMGEEKLGMGKNEVLEVLKMILDTKSYPLYIADIDGISHTTLIIACLRKLQGWHMDSIINEICRFEPEYQDLPLLPFIQSFLSPTSPESFVLPHPPYPSFLWPGPGPVGQGGAGGSNVPSSSTKSRDRASSTLPPVSSGSGSLPFPHPLSSRRHPNMKLTFPILPPPPIPQGSVQGVGQLMTPPLGASPMVGLSRVNSRRDKVPQQLSIAEEKEGNGGMIRQAVNSITNIPSAEISSQDEGRKTLAEGDGVSSEKQPQNQIQKQNQGQPPSIPIPIPSTQSSPLKLSREQTHTTSTETSSDQYASTEEDLQEENRLPLSDYQDDDDEYYEDENEDEDEDDDEEDEDDEDEGNEPTSQYISALDLAGFG